MANTLDSIINYLADAVVKDTNGDAELNDLKLKLDTTAAAGTTDGDLYAVIQRLGIESDVVDSSSDVIVKKMLTKICERFTCEEFTCTRNSSIPRGDCTGIYDKASGKVTLTFHFYTTTDVQSSTNIFTVPQKYRPSSTKSGAAVYVTNSNATSAYLCSVNASGSVFQTLGNTIRQGFGVIEYKL